MHMLEAWKSCLPTSFEPIRIANSCSTPRSNSDSTSLAPIWIHPPSHAAAIQMYHFSRIVMVLSQPSMGGLNNYQTRFKMLRESTNTICGIAVAQQSQNVPSAFVGFQAVYAGKPYLIRCCHTFPLTPCSCSVCRQSRKAGGDPRDSGQSVAHQQIPVAVDSE